MSRLHVLVFVVVFPLKLRVGRELSCELLARVTVFGLTKFNAMRGMYSVKAFSGLFFSAGVSALSCLDDPFSFDHL